MRKIAVVGGFAVGAALTLAPLAAADTPITSTLEGEIASLNSLFSDEASLTGVGSDVIPGTTTQPYDTIPLADAPDTGTTPTTFGEALYGVDSIAQAGSSPGSYDLFNGASGEFDNALNVELYSLENGGALAPSADLLGTGDVTAALDTGTVTGALDSFYNAGIADLSGYFDTNLSFLDITPVADSAASVASLF
jgi:hypothetical protein